MLTSKIRKGPSIGVRSLWNVCRTMRLKTEAVADPTPACPSPTDPANLFGRALLKYHGMFGATGIGDPLPDRAPVPDNLKRRSQDVKGAGYFLVAAGMGICKISENSWFTDSERLSHTHAVVVVIQHGRTPEEDNLAHAWVNGLEAAAAEVRAFQIAIAVAEHIQWMGFAATAHDAREGAVNLDRLAVLSGLAVRAEYRASLHGRRISSPLSPQN